MPGYIVTGLMQAGAWIKGIFTAKGIVAGVARAFIMAAASSAISKALTKTPRMDGRSAEPMESVMDTALSSMPPSRFVYGKTTVGGSFVYISTSKAYHKNAAGTITRDGAEDNLLHMVIELASHPCEAIDNVYLEDVDLNLTAVSAYLEDSIWPDASGADDNSVTRYRPDGTDYDDVIMVKLYTGAQTVADDDLIEATSYKSDGKWTTSHIGKGKTYVYIRAFYNPEVFNGIPNFTFTLRGKNDINNYNATSQAYTANPALCLADYLTTPRDEGGVGETWDQIDETALLAAVNVCDESVTVYNDTTAQSRYVIGGSFPTSNSPDVNITNILATMAGWMERINGKWVISAGEYSAPAMTITASEFRDFAETSINNSIRDVYNRGTAILRSENTSWYPSPADSVEALQKIDVTTNYAVDANQFNATGHGLSDGDRVRFISWSGTAIDNSNLPAGLSETAYYYVVDSAADTFEVSLTSGGAAVTLTSDGSGTIVALFDAYLTEDGERITRDFAFDLVNDETQARRLTLINLLQSRQEVAARLKLMPATPYACPFDLKVGDSVRWIDAHKSFWESTGSITGANSTSPANTVNKTSHGLNNNDPIIFTTTTGSGIPTGIIFYVINKAANTFQISRYRGGPVFDIPTTIGTGAIELDTIQGKLFRVVGWRFIVDDGLIGVDVDLAETASNIYTWTSGYEVVPPDRSAITVKPTNKVETLDGLAVTSGDSTILIRDDGTVLARAKLAWTATTDGYVQQGGYVDIEYKETSTIDFTTDYAADANQLSATAHGLLDGAKVWVRTTGTLPTGLAASTNYYIVNKATDTVELSRSRGGDPVAMTSDGTGTHTIDPQDTWQTWGDVAGSSTIAYLADLNDGTDYDFRARFKNSRGAFGLWDVVVGHELVGDTTPPAVPTSLSASSNQTNGVLLTWTDPTDLDLSKIEIYRDDGAAGTSVYLATVQRGAEKYRDLTAKGNAYAGSGGTSSKSYLYKIRAVDTSGNASSFTSTATGSVSAPSGPASASGSGGSLNATATWSNSGEFATVLVGLYLDDPNPGTIQVWKTVPASDETITVSASAGTGYYFVLRYIIFNRTAGTEYSQASTTSTFTVSSPL